MHMACLGYIFHVFPANEQLSAWSAEEYLRLRGLRTRNYKKVFGLRAVCTAAPGPIGVAIAGHLDTGYMQETGSVTSPAH